MALACFAGPQSIESNQTGLPCLLDFYRIAQYDKHGKPVYLLLQSEYGLHRIH